MNLECSCVYSSELRRTIRTRVMNGDGSITPAFGRLMQDHEFKAILDYIAWLVLQ